MICKYITLQSYEVYIAGQLLKGRYHTVQCIQKIQKMQLQISDPVIYSNIGAAP
jgi:hypothetical protein